MLPPLLLLACLLQLAGRAQSLRSNSVRVHTNGRELCTKRGEFSIKRAHTKKPTISAHRQSRRSRDGRQVCLAPCCFNSRRLARSLASSAHHVQESQLQEPANKLEEMQERRRKRARENCAHSCRIVGLSLFRSLVVSGAQLCCSAVLFQFLRLSFCATFSL